MPSFHRGGQHDIRSALRMSAVHRCGTGDTHTGLILGDGLLQRDFGKGGEGEEGSVLLFWSGLAVYGFFLLREEELHC